MQLLHFGNDGIKLLFVRRMGKASIKAHSIMMVNSETDSTAVVERIEYSTVSKVGSKTTLLDHLTRECGKDKMESFVEEHNYRPLGCYRLDRLWLLDRCAVRHSRREAMLWTCEV